MPRDSVEVAVIGAGNAGIATAYYLARDHGVSKIAIVDLRDPMSLTSAQSGDNYRNWWPHPVMTAYTNDSIGLLEEIAAETGNRINMTRRGYALVTRRKKPAELIDDLYRGYGEDTGAQVRIHDTSRANAAYVPAASADWRVAPNGVDVLCDRDLIRSTFPNYASDVETVLHIRRAGSISGQQLGQFMLEQIRAKGGKLVRGEVVAIEGAAPFKLDVKTASGNTRLRADRIVNAAGPFLQDVGRFIGEDLDVHCVYQQKIAFEDSKGAVPRNVPFTIDLDGQHLNWTGEEREILASDSETEKLTRFMSGGIHCRPDGAESGKWIKLGWAFNETESNPHVPDATDDQFPDLVLRAASRLQPKLAAYIGRLPRGMHHYGGYYTMTKENWPLIGPMKTEGAFIVGALSGFGTMAACASGWLCAGWMMGSDLPAYAKSLSPERYGDDALMTELTALKSRGVL